MKISHAAMIGLVGSLLVSSCADQTGDTATVVDVVSDSESATTIQGREAETTLVTPAEVTVVSMEHLFGLQQADEVLLIDCRAALIHRMGSIDGSINLPTKQFETKYPERKAQLDAAIKAGQIIVLYCQNEKCPYAYTVAKKLSKKGFPVTIYNGGWEEWKQAGFN